MKEVLFEQLPEEEQKLIRAARKALKRAYNPYSKFAVGAALLTTRGEIVTGTNFEVAAYSNAICAERTAIVRANVMGLGNICKEIAVVAKNYDSPTTEVTSPCGSCRQMIYELAQRSGIDKNFQVIMATTKFDKVIVATIGELLPLAFGPKDLGIESET